MTDDVKFTVLGIGGAGCRVLGTLRQLPGAERIRLLAVDTDRNGLEQSGLAPEYTLLAGERWRRGMGCGGSVSDGKSAVGSIRANIAGMLAGSDMLMVVGGLGGGTASGGVATVLSEASRLEIPNIALVTMPFSHEGNLRRRQASSALNEEIYNIADAVISLPNDLLFTNLEPSTPAVEIYRFADEQMARTVLALTHLLCAGNLLNADFASFAALLKRKKSRCSIGVGISRPEDGVHSPEKIFEDMISSPLLGGSSRLLEADAVIFSLLGGDDLAIGDMQRIFGLGERFIKQDVTLLSSASTSPAWQGMLQFTAVAIKFEKTKAVSAGGKGSKKQQAKEDDADSLFSHASTEQLGLPFAQVSKGIMESTQKVLWEGEDLDIPTYIRREQVIDTGKRIAK